MNLTENQVKRLKPLLIKLVNEVKMELNEVDDDKKIQLLKTNMPGYIGPDFAKKADGQDILAMSDLKDELGRIRGLTQPIITKINALRKKYKLGPEPK